MRDGHAADASTGTDAFAFVAVQRAARPSPFSFQLLLAALVVALAAATFFVLSGGDKKAASVASANAVGQSPIITAQCDGASPQWRALV